VQLHTDSQIDFIVVLGGVAQWLGHRSLAGELSLI